MLSLEKQLELSGEFDIDATFLWKLLVFRIGQLNKLIEKSFTRRNYERFARFSTQTLEIAYMLRNVSLGTEEVGGANETYSRLFRACFDAIQAYEVLLSAKEIIATLPVGIRTTLRL